MELHPILEAQSFPNSGLWYVISAFGNHPSERVGHTCTYIPGPDGTDGKLYVIGGANPNGPYSDVYVLDLATFSWEVIDSTGLKPRYEHAAFVPKSKPHLIYVFAGADQGGNNNDMQIFDTTNQSWSNVTVTSGNAPSPRTYHVTSVCEDNFIVYSGGQAGSDPVGDRQVHCFNAASHSWTTLNVKGDPPKPRHGHIVVAGDSKIYIHGGMSGTTFYDDLHVLDIKHNTWTHYKAKKNWPCARAAHAGCINNGMLYVFGGMCKDGALDDTFCLNLGTMKWSRVEVSGPPPACRLDFGLCSVRLRVPQPNPDDVTEDTQQMLNAGARAKDVVDEELRLGSAGSVRSVSSSAGSQRSEPVLATAFTPDQPTVPPPRPVAAPIEGPTQVVDMCLVLAGMDTEGEIFDDCLVYRLNVTDESSDAAKP